jgi:hypothetical protein
LFSLSGSRPISSFVYRIGVCRALSDQFQIS